jgi:hypothetical protein
MKKHEKLVSVLMISVAILCGCSSVNKTGQPENILAQERKIPSTQGLNNCETYQDAGLKMIISVIDGLNAGNYDLYSRDFSDKFKGHFTRAVFEQANKAVKDNIGEWGETQYVGEWVKGDFHIMLWKARCSKTKDDVLIEMYVKKTDDKYKIEGLKLI